MTIPNYYNMTRVFKFMINAKSFIKLSDLPYQQVLYTLYPAIISERANREYSTRIGE